jgi:hypothetical protein
LRLFEAEAQGSSAERNFLDFPAELLVVAVALAAALTATLQPFPGVEDQVELAAVAADPVHPLRSDEAIQVLQGTDTLAGLSQPVQAMVAGSPGRRRGRGRDLACHRIRSFLYDEAGGKQVALADEASALLDFHSAAA